MTVIERLEALEHQADEFGFSWDNAMQIIEQIRSECNEVLATVDKPLARQHLQEEIGDLLHAAFSLCVFCNFSAEDTLTRSVDKFERRLKSVKAFASEDGLHTLKGKSFKELMAYWDKAKHQVG